MWFWWFILICDLLVHLPFRYSSEDAIGILSLVVMFLQIMALITPICFTEKALQKTFDENGNKR